MRAAAIFAVILACNLGVGGCHVEVEGHRVANHTAQALEIVWLHDGSETVVGHVSPGLELPVTLFHAEECSTGVLVARGAGEREVARRTTPLCPDDTWVVSELEPSAASS
jgi:hypothetical protein